MNYDLAKDGDQLEQYACKISLLPGYFPSYALFWERFVVPLTYRPKDLRLRTDADLPGDLRVAHTKISIAQLHYSVLANLIIAFQIMNKKLDYSSSGVDGARVTHFFINSFASIDIATDLILRYKDLPSHTFGPWDDESLIKTRREFQKTEPDDIKNRRLYRNRLVHGRLMPGFKTWPDGVDGHVPKVGLEKEYLDWRKITTPTEPTNVNEFQTEDSLMDETFRSISGYLESLWQTHLL